MAKITTHKAAITLYSSPTCALSHCARFVLSEKTVEANIEYYDPTDPPEALLELNPNGASPTLIERELVLYDARIIMEYLDERFPHPPLHPMDPVSRANARMLIKRIDNDWYQLLNEILFSGEKKSSRAKKMLRESILSSAPIFAARPYFMSDEFSLIDCAIAPLLWRLPSLGIDVTTSNEVVNNYGRRIFSRPGFKHSLSDAEIEMAE